VIFLKKMNPQKETIVIDKDHYYKTYMEQRQKLHVNLVQQLHLRAEAKKNHILSKSNEIIDKFNNYRDEFLKNMPAELKTLKVKDYINQSDGTLQVFLKQADSEEGMSNLYKLFQHEFEKANNHQAQKPTENFVYNNNNNHDKQNSEQDDTVLEFIDSIKENPHQKAKFDLESNKPSAMKSKVKTVATPLKSTKKRKFDQMTSAGKENNNLGLLSKSKAINGNGTAKKVLLEKTNTMKIQPIPSQNNPDLNKLTASPNKRPWMP